MNNTLKIRNAFIVGAVPAVLEGILIFLADPEASNWIVIQSIFFWFTCGFVVYLVNIGYRKILVSLLLTVFLNIPWFIALTVVANQPDHLIPLLVASIIMGTLIGLLSAWLNKPMQKSN
ncbi:MAG: hypothetical protein HYZ14_08335 [Bacteroidetes bacterium]|nr:hypothetical protein [Bacteroidota bacterium]